MNLSLGIHDFLSQFACKIEGQNGINRQKAKFFTPTAKDNREIKIHVYAKRHTSDSC